MGGIKVTAKGVDEVGGESRLTFSFWHQLIGCTCFRKAHGCISGWLVEVEGEWHVCSIVGRS